MTSPRRNSAIYELDLTVYGGPTSYEEFNASLTTGVLEILNPDPDRLAYWVTNNGADDARWACTNEIIQAGGHILGSGMVLIVRARDDGAMTGERLFMRAATTTCDLTVSVVKRYRRG